MRSSAQKAPATALLLILFLLNVFTAGATPLALRQVAGASASIDPGTLALSYGAPPKKLGPPAAGMQTTGSSASTPVADTASGRGAMGLSKPAAQLLFSQYNETATVVPAISWNGSHALCKPGDTSLAFKVAMLRRINYFRIQAGVGKLTKLDPILAKKAQTAALLISRNKALSTAPPKTWACRSTIAIEALQESNLILGRNGPGAIDGYMLDAGQANSAVGHRRWLLHPPTRAMASGDIPAVAGFPSANALWVTDKNLWNAAPMRDGLVAWPPPGFTPARFFYPRWSFSIPDADFTNAVVTVNKIGNTTVKATITQLPSEDGYGLSTLVWEVAAKDLPPALAGNAEFQYQVVIKGVIVSGLKRSFNYRATAFAA